ncbi:MAG: 2-oxo acid dehydrogenase subunit E2 [Planctomycetota bacterium]
MAGKVSSDPNIFLLPDLGEGLEEAELVAWKVSEGDSVDEHQIMAEMETDKALVEVPSPRSGTIGTLHGGAGDIIKVGAPLVTYQGGAAPTAAPTKAADNGSPAKAEAAPAEESEDAGTVVGSVGGQSFNAAPGKALATPAVRRLARDLGVDINAVPGSGIGGRVTKKDVEAFGASGGASPAPKTPAASPAPASTGTPPTATHASAPAPASQPYQPTPQPQGYPQPAAYPQQQMMPGMQPAPMAGQMPGMGMPMMPAPMMLVPVPVPYPYTPQQAGGQAGGQGGGIPAMPGYQPSTQRPIPGPAQRADIPAGDATHAVPFRGVRRTIANRLRESVSTAVHFTVMDEAEVTAIDALRRQHAASTGDKLSYLPFVAAAVCRVLSGRFGALNATTDDAGEQVIQHKAVHLGIATDTDNGLMVPVVRDAQAQGPAQLQKSITMVAASARDRSAPREMLSGSTFTISNVGSHAGKFATPIINYPEVAILAAGRVFDGVVVASGQPAVAKVMPLSLACDHRVVDGATAALALAEIVELLQNPHTLMG